METAYFQIVGVSYRMGLNQKYMSIECQPLSAGKVMKPNPNRTSKPVRTKKTLIQMHHTGAWNDIMNKSVQPIKWVERDEVSGWPPHLPFTQYHEIELSSRDGDSWDYDPDCLESTEQFTAESRLLRAEERAKKLAAVQADGKLGRRSSRTLDNRAWGERYSSCSPFMGPYHRLRSGLRPIHV